MKIGIESTYHNGQNLKLFIEANGFIFVEFDPLRISIFVRGKYIRNTETDFIDAQCIAR